MGKHIRIHVDRINRKTNKCERREEKNDKFHADK